jgi:F-type H+-transporting ATPase subunit epsilon
MKLSLTTPKGALVDADVEEVTAPGELGELGVLPGHVPLMTALRPGVLSYKAKDHDGVVAVGQGFLQVAPLPRAEDALGRDRVLVLVDQAMTAADVDREAAARDLAEADKQLAAWKGELDGAAPEARLGPGPPRRRRPRPRRRALETETALAGARIAL